jgi:limonene-1,2-epoxide hydrolase
VPDPNTIVTNFVKEFDAEKPDMARILPYFTDDALYHNIPMDPVRGKEAIGKILGGMGSTMLSKGWEIRNQCVNGNVVMNERIDRFAMGDKKVEIPVVGVFVLQGDKIAEWRDYFDLAMFQKQMA